MDKCYNEFTQHREMLTRPNGWYLLPAVCFLLLNFAVSPVKTFFFSRLIYFLFLILLFFFLRRFNLDNILPTIIGGISIVLFSYGIIQKFILFPIYLNNISAQDNFYSKSLIIRVQSGRIFSIFSLPTLYAIICVILIIFTFHYILKSSETKKRVFWVFLLVFGLFNLVLSQSFGGILYLFAGILIYLIVSGILKLKYLVPVMMVLSLFFFIIIALRFTEAKSFEPILLRLSNWVQCLRIIGANPFWGCGLGNYESEVSSYTLSSEAKSIYSHNFFLQFTAEAGLIITVILLLFLFFMRKKWMPAPHLCKEKNVYIAMFFVLVIYNLIDIGSYFFSAGIACVVVLSQVYLKLPAKENIKEKKLFKHPGLWVNVAFLVLLGLLLIVENISDNHQKSGDFLASQNNIEGALNEYQRSLSIYSLNYKSLIGCANMYFMKGNDSESMVYLNRVLSIYPDFSFGNFLKSRIEYKRGCFFRAFYYASAAYQKNKVNNQYRQWFESMKNSLESSLRVGAALNR